MPQIQQFPGPVDYLTQGVLAGAKFKSMMAEVQSLNIRNQILQDQSEREDKLLELKEQLTDAQTVASNAVSDLNRQKYRLNELIGPLDVTKLEEELKDIRQLRGLRKTGEAREVEMHKLRKKAVGEGIKGAKQTRRLGEEKHGLSMRLGEQGLKAGDLNIRAGELDLKLKLAGSLASPDRATADDVDAFVESNKEWLSSMTGDKYEEGDFRLGFFKDTIKNISREVEFQREMLRSKQEALIIDRQIRNAISASLAETTARRQQFSEDTHVGAGEKELVEQAGKELETMEARIELTQNGIRAFEMAGDEEGAERLRGELKKLQKEKELIRGRRIFKAGSARGGKTTRSGEGIYTPDEIDFIMALLDPESKGLYTEDQIREILDHSKRAKKK